MQTVTARKILNASAIFWFATALIGMLIFTIFITSKYGGSAIQGNAEEVWNAELTHGYEPGKLASNLATMVHLFFAAVITFGGPLQVMPQVRNRFPRFHRFNGRVYISTALLMSFSGLYLLWTTGTVGGLVMKAGQSFNGIVIIICAVLAYKFARARNFVTHRRWALRLFLVVSGVWFFRVGLMAWFGIHQAPVGMDVESFTGPFVTFLVFAETLVPLFILQLYFYAQDKASNPVSLCVAFLLILCTLLTAFGVFMATVGMWFPSLMSG